ncbi:MAG: DUF4402 domain-containing protein [Alphaproteobacteria bacterium]|nr:DUF4402 domain-containing protein [Alphaproteobacteria bacterium]
MRKYFLLGAVALLAASNANATTDYAEVTAKATIQVASSATCDILNFGTIVVKQGNEDSTVTLDSDDYSKPIITGDILSVSGANVPACSFGDGTGELTGGNSLPTSLTLTGDKTGETMTVTNFEMYDESDYSYYILATLNIPAGVAADVYTGSFTVYRAYE